MLKETKRASLTIGKACGLYGLSANSRRRKSRLLVLGYHGVSLQDEHLWRPALFFDSETFRSRMEALRRNDCQVLPLGEALQLLYRGELPARAVVLTFDDGTYDFVKLVYPVLKEYGYPATLYLTTYWVTVGRPVVPVIWSYLLWKARGRKYLGPKILGSGVLLDLTCDLGSTRALEAIVSVSRENHLDGPGKDAITQELAEILGADYEGIRRKRLLHLVQPEEIRQVASDGVSVQLHMHHHLSPDDEQEFKRDLSENRAFIAGLVGSLPNHFCYPGGQYEAKFVRWLGEFGIISATTCDPGLAARNTDPFLVPRLVDTSYLSALEFESWLVGIGELLPHRRLNSNRVA